MELKSEIRGTVNKYNDKYYVTLGSECQSIDYKDIPVEGLIATGTNYGCLEFKTREDVEEYFTNNGAIALINALRTTSDERLEITTWVPVTGKKDDLQTEYLKVAAVTSDEKLQNALFDTDMKKGTGSMIAEHLVLNNKCAPDLLERIYHLFRNNMIGPDLYITVNSFISNFNATSVLLKDIMSDVMPDKEEDTSEYLENKIKTICLLIAHPRTEGRRKFEMYEQLREHFEYNRIVLAWESDSNTLKILENDMERNNRR